MGAHQHETFAWKSKIGCNKHAHTHGGSCNDRRNGQQHSVLIDYGDFAHTFHRDASDAHATQLVHEQYLNLNGFISATTFCESFWFSAYCNAVDVCNCVSAIAIYFRADVESTSNGNSQKWANKIKKQKNKSINCEFVIYFWMLRRANNKIHILPTSKYWKKTLLPTEHEFRNEIEKINKNQVFDRSMSISWFTWKTTNWFFGVKRKEYKIRET